MRQLFNFLFSKTSTRLLVGCWLQLGVVVGLHGQTAMNPPSNAKITITLDSVVIDPTPAPSSAPAARLGGHALGYYRLSGSALVLTSSGITTQGSGSTIVACVGRGDLSAFSLPRDNKGNAPYRQLGPAHPYALWGGSGTALYAFESAVGGTGHTVATDNRLGDEITMAVVEVANGGLIQDYKWNEVLSGSPLTSLSVTTTGPATLVAFWWGDAGVDSVKTALPNNGFVVIDSILEAGALVQCAVAAKEVSAAGTYNVTWSATPQQGAQLWLVAVQRAP